jgi:hypothetical protein
MKYKDNFNPTVSNNSVFNDILEEKESGKIGYYDLVHQDTTEFKEFAKTVKQKISSLSASGGALLEPMQFTNF